MLGVDRAAHRVEEEPVADALVAEPADLQVGAARLIRGRGESRGKGEGEVG